MGCASGFPQQSREKGKQEPCGWRRGPEPADRGSHHQDVTCMSQTPEAMGQEGHLASAVLFLKAHNPSLITRQANPDLGMLCTAPGQGSSRPSGARKTLLFSSVNGERLRNCPRQQNTKWCLGLDPGTERGHEWKNW